ncbi:hypothetical protein DH2020_040040 [Rehmannia glutinosa]|uniref:Thylakoid lumenal 15.0 kDa protein n=1 Tax=Rehmannia glutinosa TaxID=99300 RepID=A0ABR0UU38_REHGL
MAFRLQLPSSSSSLTLPHKNPLPLFTNQAIRASSLPQNTPQFRKILKLPQWVSSFQPKSLNFLLSGTLALALSLTGVEFAEGKTGVNKPELLPKEFTTVIDVAGFCPMEKRIVQEIAALEKDTGYKLRVLAQNYPDTPGLAIKDFWKVDDNTIVFVADPTFDIPRSFWSRLAWKYGNIFYWKEKGEDASIEAAVMAISTCLREPVGANNCSEVN